MQQRRNYFVAPLSIFIVFQLIILQLVEDYLLRHGVLGPLRQVVRRLAGHIQTGRQVQTIRSILATFGKQKRTRYCLLCSQEG